MERTYCDAVVSIFAITAIVAAAEKKKKKHEGTRSWLLRRQQERGTSSMLQNELLDEDPSAYENYLSMDDGTFQQLLSRVTSKIYRRDMVMRESISPYKRLATTLRFLATWETFRSLMYSTRIHESTISKFVPEVCSAIYEVLKEDHVKMPTKAEEWVLISKGYEEKWNFPNCVGSLDGKHVSFRPPRSSGSEFYNYKGAHSIVLLAMVDANYKFIYINVGCNGRISDGGVFRQSSLYRAIVDNSINLPPAKSLPGLVEMVPYVVIANNAFPLMRNLLKPFKKRGLTCTQRIFNYRLSRARRCVENAFGILSNRFRILLTPISLGVRKVEGIVLAVCALHNFLLDRGSPFDFNEGAKPLSQGLNQQAGNRPSNEGLQTRILLEQYFNSPVGQVDWQHSAIENFCA